VRPVLQFITKAGGCSLCDEAFEEIQDAKEYVDFDLEVIALSEGDAMWEEYKHDFPVGLIDGKVVFKHRTTRDLLIGKIRKFSKPRPKWKFWS
jgi:hypothetical protein